MITGSRDTEDGFSRDGYALYLLESSGYDEQWRELLSKEISEGSPDEIEIIIEDLLQNQIDTWNSYRQKDIKRRLDQKC